MSSTSMLEYERVLSDERDVWVFGYGSLIWKTNFSFKASRVGYIHGYKRRFWQGSTDHRGTSRAPGRVVTLLPLRNNESRLRTFGVAFLIDAKNKKEVLSSLDYREKGGYTHAFVRVYFTDDKTSLLNSSSLCSCSISCSSSSHTSTSSSSPSSSSASSTSVDCSSSSSTVTNKNAMKEEVEDESKLPSALALTYIATDENDCYLGPAPLAQMAQQIARSVGPSGANKDYLFELASALRVLQCPDKHTFTLERLVREILENESKALMVSSFPVSSKSLSLAPATISTDASPPPSSSASSTSAFSSSSSSSRSSLTISSTSTSFSLSMSRSLPNNCAKDAKAEPSIKILVSNPSNCKSTGSHTV
eukprot:TRINITY_DN83_c0_g1_i1.p1 TRINITY_DN83_c0_g1~~TRINITY_DN83_c0_g1_i1.p1  ORF type:complete len:363 (-),score=74.40 TRINITY_DN83_c0_g1_i1:196-1284(-)